MLKLKTKNEMTVKNKKFQVKGRKTTNVMRKKKRQRKENNATQSCLFKSPKLFFHPLVPFRIASSSIEREKEIKFHKTLVAQPTT